MACALLPLRRVAAGWVFRWFVGTSGEERKQSPNINTKHVACDNMPLPHSCGHATSARLYQEVSSSAQLNTAPAPAPTPEPAPALAAVATPALPLEAFGCAKLPAFACFWVAAIAARTSAITRRGWGKFWGGVGTGSLEKYGCCKACRCNRHTHRHSKRLQHVQSTTGRGTSTYPKPCNCSCSRNGNNGIECS